jgi:hypothetical protein
MRTFSIGRSKVQHVPDRDDQVGVHSLCGKMTGQGTDHADGTPTCKPCLRALALAEDVATNFNSYRDRRAAAEKAEQAKREREAAELAEAFANRPQYGIHTATLVPYGEKPDMWVSRSNFEGTDADGPWVEYRTYSRYVKRQVTGTLLYVGPDGAARHEFFGPEQPGPDASFIPNDTMISAHPQARPAQVVELAEGDTVLFNGMPLVLVDDRGDAYPRFVTPARYGLLIALRAVQDVALEQSKRAIAAQSVRDDDERKLAREAHAALGAAQAAIRGRFDTLPWDGRQPASGPLKPRQAAAVVRLLDRYALRNLLLETGDDEAAEQAALERLKALGDMGHLERLYLRKFGWLARHEQRAALDQAQPGDRMHFSRLNDLGWVIGGSTGVVAEVEREPFGGHVVRLVLRGPGQDVVSLSGWELDHVRPVWREREGG